jgi:C_GCAxxG_C_C family probable redox protein
MKKQEIEKSTFQYHQSGFHCAEAIVKSVVEAFAEKPIVDLPKAASVFNGGVAGSREELCGALAGGLIAIGYLKGRTKPGEDLTDAKALANSLRQQFIAQYGATQCRKVLDHLGPQDNSMKCKELTANVAGMLARLIKKD